MATNPHRNDDSAADSKPISAAVYRIPEAADRLSVSERTVQRLLGEGQLERVKIGRSTRIPVKSVEDFIKKGGTAR